MFFRISMIASFRIDEDGRCDDLLDLYAAESRNFPSIVVMN